jgi:hypothetical protein
MRSGILAIVFIIVIGVMFANILANPTGTKVVTDALTNLWSTSISGLQSKAKQ